MTLYILILMMAFLLNLTGMTFYRVHLISVLLCIESMMLVLYILLANIALTTISPNMATTPLILLTLSACEAGTGLALLVATTRTHSSDHLNTMNLLQC
uniref:NADH-ubiquinone oxidoreductase chain 4L n=1 Tax=Diplometopon zarudnyi TaxID=94420 RepID=Q66SW9_DIPZA|nr:NADH dehydrogenase subunit 4L [Diplometopon zarudnyi]AAT08511.1 NADH dehydrogenase subunit 4L [Diplometopon zarudnyi]